MVPAANLLQHGKRDVGQLSIVIENKRLADGSQVGCGEAGEEVLVETHGSIHGGEGRHLDVAAVAEGHVVSPLQVRESSGQTPAVGLDGESLRNVTQLSVNRREVWVVVDVERVHRRQVDAVQGVELGVGDQHIGSFGHLGSEGKILQLRQRGPFDGVDSNQAREVEGLQSGQARQLEILANRRQAISRQSGQVGGTITRKTAGDLLNAVQLDGVGGLRGNNDVAGEGCAAGQGRSITRVLDRGCGLATLSYSPVDVSFACFEPLPVLTNS